MPNGEAFIDLKLDGMRGATVDFYRPPQTVQGPDGFEYVRVNKMSWMQETKPAPANNGIVRFDEASTLAVGDLSARQAYAVPEEGKQLYAIFKDGVPVGYTQRSSFEDLVNSLNPPSRSREVAGGMSAQLGISAEGSAESTIGSSFAPVVGAADFSSRITYAGSSFTESVQFRNEERAWKAFQEASLAIESGSSPPIERLRAGDMLVKEMGVTGPIYKEADQNDIGRFNQVLEGDSNRNRALYLVLPDDWRESYASLSRSQRDRVSQSRSMDGVARAINDEVAANNIYYQAISDFDSNVKSPPISLLSENQRLVVSLDEKGLPITVAATPEMVRQFNQELNGSSNRVRAAWLGLDANERDTFIGISKVEREKLVDRSRDFESLRGELNLTAGLNASSIVVDYQLPGQLETVNQGNGFMRTGSDPNRQYPGDIPKTVEPDQFYHVEPVGDRPLRSRSEVEISQPSGFGDHNKPILPDWAETALPLHFPASTKPEMPDNLERIELDPQTTKHDALTNTPVEINYIPESETDGNHWYEQIQSAAGDDASSRSPGSRIQKHWFSNSQHIDGVDLSDEQAEILRQLGPAYADSEVRQGLIGPAEIKGPNGWQSIDSLQSAIHSGAQTPPDSESRPNDSSEPLEEGERLNRGGFFGGYRIERFDDQKGRWVFDRHVSESEARQIQEQTERQQSRLANGSQSANSGEPQYTDNFKPNPNAQRIGKGYTAEVTGTGTVAEKIGFFDAKTEAENLAALAKAGVPVPRVFKYGKVEGSIKEAIQMEQIPGGRNLQDILDDSTVPTEIKESFKRRVEDTYEIMKRNEIAVTDISPKNLVVSTEGKLYVIDAQNLVRGSQAVRTAEEAEKSIIQSINNSVSRQERAERRSNQSAVSPDSHRTTQETSTREARSSKGPRDWTTLGRDLAAAEQHVRDADRAVEQAREENRRQIEQLIEEGKIWRDQDGNIHFY
ncbi:MAG: RIO1 family regulatory kinase/ATPase [Candidatus Obscuribacter sp.]|nr:RIO1 family regulatory kinase/ATPase [Candidatus Obscuribacter sp.]